MRIAGAAHGGRCYREALLALLVAGAFFSTAHEANAKFRARHHTQIPHSHHISVVRPGPVPRLENQRPGDIYESALCKSGPGFLWTKRRRQNLLITNELLARIRLLSPLRPGVPIVRQ
jgi:hypothetical protein